MLACFALFVSFFVYQRTLAIIKNVINIKTYWSRFNNAQIIIATLCSLPQLPTNTHTHTHIDINIIEIYFFWLVQCAFRLQISSALWVTIRALRLQIGVTDCPPGYSRSLMVAINSRLCPAAMTIAMRLLVRIYRHFICQRQLQNYEKCKKKTHIRAVRLLRCRL